MEKVTTRVFGEIGVEEEKVITFPGGIVGFPDLRRFKLIYDEDKGSNVGIRWLQSIDEPMFAIPVMDPLLVKPDYNPVVDDDLLKEIGELNEENLLVLVSVNVPIDLNNISVNLQAPFVVNADTRKAVQVIVENEEYTTKFLIYDIIKKKD